MSNANPSGLPTHHEDHPETISRNASRGLVLFILYLALYGTFVAINIFDPDRMSQTTLAGISLGGPNLAIVGGIGLIFAAFLLALVYMRLTRTPRS
jgi:uncharacterized membrane protein (DUF485 family)